MAGRTVRERGWMALVAGGAVATVVGAAALRGGIADAAPLQAAHEVRQLAWLAGCWARESGATLVEEQWMRPRGGAMLGMSRTIRRDTVVEYEHLRIFDRGGRAVYAALPSGQALTEFESAAIGDTLVIFENPAHDFPQRVIYRRRGADSLIARIEGTRGGRPSAVDFPFRRVAC